MKKKLLFLMSLALGASSLSTMATKTMQIKATADGVTLVGGTSLYANSENKVSGLTYDIQIRNMGDEDLIAGEDEFSLSLIDYKTASNYTVLATYHFTEDLEANGSFDTFHITWDDFSIDYLLNSSESYNNSYHYYGSRKLYIRLNQEDGSSSITQKPSSSFSIYDYRTDFKLVGESNTTEVSKAFLGFQEGDEPLEVTYRIQNNGAKPLNFTNVTVPEGFSISPEAPITVPGKTEVENEDDLFKPFTIIFNPERSGVYEGTFVFTSDDVTKELTLQAIKKSDEYLEDFEDAPSDGYEAWMPKGWKKIAPEDGTESQWKVTTTLTGIKNNGGGIYILKQDGAATDAKQYIRSPRLLIEEGEKMIIGVARYNNASYHAIIYWQNEDGLTPLRHIANTLSATKEEDEPAVTDGFNAANNLKYFTLENIPAGEGNLLIKGLACGIDNVFGGHLVELEEAELKLEYTFEHDPKTGLNDVVITWGYPEEEGEEVAEQANKARAKAPQKAATFKVSVNGGDAENVEGFSHTITELPLGSHTVSITPVYDGEDGTPVELAVEMPEENYAALTIEINASKVDAFNGEEVVVKSKDSDREYTAEISDGVAKLPSLEKGEYTLSVTKEGYAPVSEDVDVDGDKTVTLNLITTGIGTISEDSVEGTLYNFAGIKIAEKVDATSLSTLPAGLYIFNGRKIVVK